MWKLKTATVCVCVPQDKYRAFSLGGGISALKKLLRRSHGIHISEKQ
uniref:Uncharacterized protein n=1 Tax=Anguilla anguilla TaxID=7936 RepID=A0A0E9WZC0_ANGAN